MTPLPPETISHIDGAAVPGAGLPDLATIHSGERVHALFLCTRKALQRTPDGRPLLVATLRSGDLVVQARTLFRVEQLNGSFDRDDVVEVMGSFAYELGTYGATVLGAAHPVEAVAQTSSRPR